MKQESYKIRQVQNDNTSSMKNWDQFKVFKWVIVGFVIFFAVVISLSVIVIVVTPYLTQGGKTVHVLSAKLTLRYLSTAEVAYYYDNNRSYGTLTDLSAKGLLDSRFRSDVANFDGYSYEGTADNGYFTITAIADDSSCPSFYINQSLVLHYVNGAPIFDEEISSSD